MADKNTANLGFEKQIWDAACVLWGHIPAAEYRNVIIGLIFLRYIGTAFEKKYAQLFYSVTIPATLWFITKGKKQTGKTVFIDARKMGYMADRKHRDFTDADIAKIADTFASFQDGTLEDVKGFCAVVTTQDIARQDYILTPGRYVGIEEQEDDGEPFEEKMTRLTSELSEMFEKSHELEDEIRKKLGAIGYEI